MSIPTGHKAAQARILDNVQAVGWTAWCLEPKQRLSVDVANGCFVKIGFG